MADTGCFKNSRNLCRRRIMNTELSGVHFALRVLVKLETDKFESFVGSCMWPYGMR